jgi:hypothetical protein
VLIVITALRRASQDPTCTVSRDPEFLRRHYDGVRHVPFTDLVIDTDAMTAGEVARTVADWARATPQAS